ncbi:MAG: C40 family peptidase [Coriobacteriia bacterium]
MRPHVSGMPLRPLLVVALSFALLAGVVPAAAAPSTPEIEKKRAEATAARSELDRMATELEIQVEEYNAISEALDNTRAQIRDTRADLEVASRELDQYQDQLAARAANIYKDGNDGMISVLLGTASFEDFISRFDLLMRINRQDAEMVASTKEAKTRVESIERSLEAREAEQVALRSEAERRGAAIEAEIVRQEDYLAALDSEVKQLMAEEAERQRKIAEERARKAAAAAAAGGGRTPTPVGNLPGGHSEVVAIALTYLGVPYRWGGASPSGFDCSGLCQYSYAQIGIELPRTSRSQYAAGAHIAPDRLDLLRAGDLVFFGTNGDPTKVHHVGIYVGDGNYVHAPQRGDVVKVSSLTERISSRGDYVGASRF